VGPCAAALTLTACGSPPEPATLTAADVAAASKPALTVSDTATLTNGDTAVVITVTLTCTAGHTAFGSAAVTDNTNASDTTQPQGYSGLLRIPCTGQAQALPLTLTSAPRPLPPRPRPRPRRVHPQPVRRLRVPVELRHQTITNVR
jgi:hypothetical protein